MTSEAMRRRSARIRARSRSIACASAGLVLGRRSKAADVEPHDLDVGDRVERRRARAAVEERELAEHRRRVDRLERALVARQPHADRALGQQVERAVVARPPARAPGPAPTWRTSACENTVAQSDAVASGRNSRSAESSWASSTKTMKGPACTAPNVQGQAMKSAKRAASASTASRRRRSATGRARSSRPARHVPGHRRRRRGTSPSDCGILVLKIRGAVLLAAGSARGGRGRAGSRPRSAGSAPARACPASGSGAPGRSSSSAPSSASKRRSSSALERRARCP